MPVTMTLRGERFSAKRSHFKPNYCLKVHNVHLKLTSLISKYGTWAYTNHGALVLNVLFILMLYQMQNRPTTKLCEKQIACRRICLLEPWEFYLNIVPPYKVHRVHFADANNALYFTKEEIIFLVAIMSRWFEEAMHQNKTQLWIFQPTWQLRQVIHKKAACGSCLHCEHPAGRTANSYIIFKEDQSSDWRFTMDIYKLPFFFK